MALFGSKKNTKKEEAPKKAPAKKVAAKKADAVAVPAASTSTGAQNLISILVRPRVTEKASVVTDKGVYVFEVTKASTKGQIKKAIKEVYKVLPVKVRTVAIPEKRVFVRGKWGVQSGGKKAYVYLKTGDKIEIL